MLSWDDEGLRLSVGDQGLCFPAVWLRDNCPCPGCLDPGTGQKLNDIAELPPELTVATAEADGASVTVTYAPDGHRSVFARDWLAGHALDRDGLDDQRTEDGKDLWRPADLAPGSGSRPEASRPEANWPEASWPQYLDAPRYRARALDAVLRQGFLLLHCLQTADDGGDTGLVDGFAAAAELRATDRAAFDVLTRYPVPFGYQDKTAVLRACQPLIQLSPRGRIAGVRFNNRSAGPLRLPYADVVAFYAAYRRWARLLAEPGRQLNLRLAPGDCLIFDNTRILHARTAFGATGGRHLQGCYADLDGLVSTVAVLRR